MHLRSLADIRRKASILIGACVLSACLGEEATPSEATSWQTDNQVSRGPLQIWNGVESESNDVAAAIAMRVRPKLLRMEIIGAGNVGTATGYYRPGCFLTNRHVLGPENQPNISHIRISGFSVMENAGERSEPSRTRTEKEEDRRKLQQGLHFQILQRKELIVDDDIDKFLDRVNARIGERPVGRDIAVFYVPPGGWRLEGGVPIPIGLPSGMYWMPDKFVVFRGLGATKTLRGAIPGETVELRGYGRRNDAPSASNEPTPPLPMGERGGIERFGLLDTFGLEACRDNRKSLTDCATLVLLSQLDKNRQNSMPGDSGGKISAGEAIVALNWGNAAPTDSGPDPGTPPMPPKMITLGANVFERETHRFLTDPTYKLDEGRNVPVTCRPKPFILHGPAVQVNRSLAGSGGRQEWRLNPRSQGGYVQAENFDDMNEYKQTFQICGRENPDIPTNEASEQCAHGTWNNQSVNNSPLINLTLQAIPWPGYKFVKWVAPSNTVCLCDPNRAFCTQTNEEVERIDPKRLVPMFSQECLAVFEKLPNEPGNCTPLNRAGCGIEK